jgi:prepilin-type N-terminal cleavage/methylation domain-containing protein
VRRRAEGFTLVELLTTIGIIAVLMAMLIPALNTVRKMAKEAEQKAQFNTIGMGLEAFKSDDGSYPESSWQNSDYQGTQRLTEALVGMDLMGFHPDSGWRSDGRDSTGTQPIYPYFAGVSLTQQQWKDNLKKRRGPYLENATDNVFRLGDLYPGPNPGPIGSGIGDVDYLRDDNYVICDVFKATKVSLPTGQMIKAGTPILYYKADTSKKTMQAGTYEDRIYNLLDDIGILANGQVAYGDLPLATRQQQEQYAHYLDQNRGSFYNETTFYKVIDQKVTTYKWPYRPDSYLLISAGWDGNFGTQDDVLNF